MKKLNVLLLIGVLLLGITQTAEAQLLRRLKDKAKEKVVERVEQKLMKSCAKSRTNRLIRLGNPCLELRIRAMEAAPMCLL